MSHHALIQINVEISINGMVYSILGPWMKTEEYSRKFLVVQLYIRATLIVLFHISRCTQTTRVSELMYKMMLNMWIVDSDI